MKKLKNLLRVLESRFSNTHRHNPIHFSDLVRDFVSVGEEKGSAEKVYSQGELVSAINSMLVPAGEIRGQGYELWREPLDPNWRTIPLPEMRA